MNKYNVIILGGGASGIFLSSYLEGLKTLIIERNTKPCVKLSITGGGKCNFTNRAVTHQDYRSSNPHFVKSALAGFTPQELILTLEKLNIKFEERDKGKLFAYNSQDIINMLMLKSYGEIKKAHKILSAEKVGSTFTVSTDKGSFQSDILVIATGGASYPKIGASGIGMKIAEHFGHEIIKPKPALTPIKYPNEFKQFGELAGIALDATITIGKNIHTDRLLFTHDSFSGPLGLLASLDYENGDEITIDFAPHFDFDKFIKEARLSKKSLTTLLSYHIPKSLAKILFSENEPDMTKLRADQREEIFKKLKSFTCKPSGVEGFAKAEVMGGGVSVDKIGSKTMESKLVENLFIIGEVMDVTGKLGGYNLQWAWASANSCGIAIKNKLTKINLI